MQALSCSTESFTAGINPIKSVGELMRYPSYAEHAQCVSLLSTSRRPSSFSVICCLNFNNETCIGFCKSLLFTSSISQVLIAVFVCLPVRSQLVVHSSTITIDAIFDQCDQLLRGSCNLPVRRSTCSPSIVNAAV